MALETCGLVSLAAFGVVLGLALPIAYITMGSLYIHECPLAPMIPIYLVVAGVMSILLHCNGGMHKNKTADMTYPSSILSLFFFIWFIFGSYHVYSIYPPNYQMNSTHQAQTLSDINRPNQTWDRNQTWDQAVGSQHCDRTLYLFAFWNITLMYVLCGAGLLITCCVYGCMTLMK